MEVNSTRQTAVASIRSRVGELAGSWLADAEAVQVSLACAVREPTELLEFVASREAARRARLHVAALAITPLEFAAVFGSAAAPMRTRPIDAVVADHGFPQAERRLSNALRCSLGERQPGAAWVRPFTRLVVHLCMHMPKHEDALEAALGGLVKADCRRLDDLRADLEDEGADLMLLSRTVVALGESVA